MNYTREILDMMRRFLLLPFILVGCPAPVSDPPAHADIKLPRTEVRGEVDIYDPNHWGALHGVYVDSIRKSRIEQTATKPSDSIDQAFLDFEMSTESDQ